MKCHTTGKIIFGCQYKADEYIKTLKRRNIDRCPVRSYLCEYCKGWHMTSQVLHQTRLNLKHFEQFKKYMNK